MPSPCNTFFSPPCATPGITPGTLPNTALSAARAGEPGSPTFDAVLTQAGEPAVAVEAEAAGSGKSSDDQIDNDSEGADETSPSAEQLALMSLIGLMPAVPTPPPVPAAPVNASSDACSDAPLAPVGAAGRSVAELLAQGVSVLEYNLPAAEVNADSADAAEPNPDGATVSARTETAFAAESAATLPPAPTVAARNWDRVLSAVYRSKESPAALATTDQSVVNETTASNASPAANAMTPEPNLSSVEQVAGLQADPAMQAIPGTTPAPSASVATSSRQVSRPGAKSAEPAVANASSRGNPPVAELKNTALTTEGQQVTSNDARVGTSAANWGKSMYDDVRKSAAIPVTDVATAVPGIEHPVTVEVATTAPVDASAPAQASRLVHEIREIADGLWAVERNSVEVKFNFGEQDRLSVRVEYRDGAVQATFRTDSPELRDAIAREWQAQPANVERPYRVAAAVFSSSSGFSSDGDPTRQQRSAEPPIPFERAVASSAVRSAASTTNPSKSGSALRQDSAGYLHALV